MTRLLIAIVLLCISFPSFSEYTPDQLVALIGEFTDFPGMQTIAERMPRELTSNEQDQLTAYITSTYPQLWPSTARFLKYDAPLLISALEKMYPGAVWAPLGRDASLIGSMLDAFYLSIGQGDRVRYLRASGTSIYGENPEVLAKFLESSGLDYNLDGHPFIIIDHSGYHSFIQGKDLIRSQSVQLVHAGFSHFMRLGYKPKDIIRKFNFVGLKIGIQHHDIDPATYFSEMNRHFSFPLANNYDHIPFRPMYVPGGITGPEWHGGYGKIKEKEGHYFTTPGERTPNSYIFTGLALLIYNFVNSKEFRKSVSENAAKLGYKFNFEKRTQDCATSLAVSGNGAA